jgi:Protein kinase domain
MSGVFKLFSGTAPDNSLNTLSEVLINQIHNFANAGKAIDECTSINIPLEAFHEEKEILKSRIRFSKLVDAGYSFSVIKERSISSVIKFAKKKYAFRFLKFFCKNVYGRETIIDDVAAKNIIRHVAGISFRKILPAYSIYLVSKPGFTYDEYIVSMKGAEEYFSRIRKSLIDTNVIPDSFDIANYMDESLDEKLKTRIDYQIRMFAMGETLSELYEILKTNPDINIDSYRSLVALTSRNSFRIAFFAAQRRIIDRSKYCKDVWEVMDYISSGKNGSVYKVCCPPDNCEYVMKVMSDKAGTQRDFFTDVKREADSWLIASEKNLAPSLIEYYMSSDDNTIPPYAIFISELMDKTADDMLDIIGDREDLQLRFYTIIVNNIEKLHNIGIIHGDCHLGNMMFVTKDKNIYSDPYAIMDALESGVIQMKFIDFGFSTTVDKANEDPTEMVYYFKFLMKRLRDLGCLEYHRGRPVSKGRFGDVLEFYDFAMAGGDLFDNAPSNDPAVLLFKEKQDALNTGCTSGI